MEALDGVIQALFAGYASERDSGVESDESNGSGVELDAVRLEQAARLVQLVLLRQLDAFYYPEARTSTAAAASCALPSRVSLLPDSVTAAVSLVNVASNALEEALEDSLQRAVFVIFRYCIAFITVLRSLEKRVYNRVLYSIIIFGEPFILC